MSLNINKLFIISEDKHPKAHQAGIRAFIDFEVNDQFKVTGYRVMEGSKGLWVAPCSTKSEGKSGKVFYNPVFKFSNPLHQEQLNADLLKAYEKELKGETSEKVLEAAY